MYSRQDHYDLRSTGAMLENQGSKLAHKQLFAEETLEEVLENRGTMLFS